MHIHDEIEICGDCLLFIANGDLPDCAPDGSRIAPEHWDAIREGKTEHPTVKAITKRWGELTRHIHPSGDEGCEGCFSWRPCGCCGATLGGDRHPAVVLCEHPGCDSASAPEVQR